MKAANMYTMWKSTKVYRLGRNLKRDMGSSVTTCEVVERTKTKVVGRDGRRVQQYKLAIRKMKVR